MARLVHFGFASHWLKNLRESFKPITRRSNRNHVITFDSHLKTALFQLMCFGFEKRKRTEVFLTSLFKMPDKTYQKQKVNLLISGSVSSRHLNAKHLSYVTKKAIAGDQVVYRMVIQNI